MRWLPHRIRLAALVFCICAAGTQASAQPPPAAALDAAAMRQFTSQYEAGLAALNQNQLAEAAAAFQAASAAQPTNTLPILGLADVAWRRGQPDVAETEIRRAMQVGWGTIPPLHALARLLAATGRVDHAINIYREIIALDPETVSARIDLADILHGARQDPGAAVPLYREALARASNHAGARYALGNALLRLGRFDEARAELRTATEASPGNPLPLQSLAVLEMRANQPAAALVALDRALAMRPQSVEIMVERGGVLLVLGRPEPALAAFRTALSSAPDAISARLGSGQALQALNRKAEADQAYAAVLQRDAGNVIALNNRAWLAAEDRRDLEQAEAWATRAAALAPGSGSVKATLGWVYRARGRLPEAAAALEAATATDATPDMLVMLGTVYLEQNRRADAANAARRALILDPGHVAARALRNRTS